MAKAPTPASDAIMTPDKMKPLLALSKHEPVQAAIGLTADGEALILLDKRAKPKKVLAMLRADAAKAKLPLNASSLRFGRAEVDADYDSAMVRFFINKDAPGNMRLKLVEVVKRVPYQKVEINVDPSLEEESEEHETEESRDAPPPVIAAAPPPPPPAAGEDPKVALSHKLAALMQGIPKVAGGDPVVQHSLAALAAPAAAALKAGDLEAARVAMEALGHAMAASMHQAAPSADLLALFRDAREEVDAGLNKLQEAMRGTQDADMIRIADLGMYGMTDGEGVGLLKALMDLRGAAPEQRAASSRAARAAAAAYKAAVFKHVLVDLVDANPFGIAVGIKAKLGPALDTIAATA